MSTAKAAAIAAGMIAAAALGGGAGCGGGSRSIGSPRPTQVVWEQLVGQDPQAEVFDLATTGDGVVVDSYPALAKYDATGKLLASHAVADGTTSSAYLSPWKTNGIAALTRDAYSGALRLDLYDASLTVAASVNLDMSGSYSIAATQGDTVYLLQYVPATSTQPSVLNLITVTNGIITNTQPIATGQAPRLKSRIIDPGGHIIFCWSVTDSQGPRPSDAGPPNVLALEVLHIDPASGQTTSTFPLPNTKGGAGCSLVKTKDGLFAMWWDAALGRSQERVAMLDPAGDAIVAGPRTVTLPTTVPTSLVYDGTRIVGSFLPGDSHAYLFTIDLDTLTAGPTYAVPTTYYDQTHDIYAAVYQGELYVALSYGVRRPFLMSTPARTILRKLAPLQ